MINICSSCWASNKSTLDFHRILQVYG